MGTGFVTQPGGCLHMWGVLLWALLSAFIIGVFFWSSLILFQQKRAWAAYAKKNGMMYEAQGVFSSPVVSGKTGAHKLSFFTDVQRTLDVRGQRMVTVIEAEMGVGMPAPAALATKDFKGFISGLNLPDTYEPGVADWKTDYVLQTRDAERLKLYLTPERLKILHGLFSMRNAAVLFFFDTEESVLRIETPDPLRDAVHMEKITKRIVDALDKLRPTAAEREQWKGSPQPT